MAFQLPTPTRKIPVSERLPTKPFSTEATWLHRHEDDWPGGRDCDKEVAANHEGRELVELVIWSNNQII
jgi:hypothetical protein